jgi:post-segregation antitoxin (ccd killing protein)
VKKRVTRISQRPASAGAALEKQWLEDNHEAIADYNRRVAERGLLSDDVGLHDIAAQSLPQ